MEFRLLGTLEVREEGRMLSIGGPKQRAVLAHLVVRANTVVTVERLIDALWGDEPPETARNTIQTYVRHLRKALGAERIQHRSAGYVLTADPAEVDALRFEVLVDEARRRAETAPAVAVEALREALSLWQGPALDDLADQASLRTEIARLEELRMTATEERIAAELDLGRHTELVPEIETLVAAHPLRERLWGYLMVALYRSGRQAEALSAHHRVRELLLEELGIDPSAELGRLQERILRQDPALEVAGEPLRGYRLLERVGAGAFGEVRRAFQPQVGREVAVKVINPRFANSPEFIRRFEVEAQLVARLEHPHIVPLYDFWREPDGAYLVMRYLRGGSLRSRLGEGPLPPERAARTVHQLAGALAAAHRQGVVHRDVKPANVLFDEEGNAYLSDFGIARDLATAEVTKGAGSSPLAYYLSPEEIQGEQATQRTDVYGLGLLLYEALAGRHPFAETPLEQVIERRLLEPLPPIRVFSPDLPAALEEVISRATAKDPAERHGGPTELAAAFREALVPAATPPAPVAAIEPRNPYKGLRPFLEADAPDFLGREALTAELVARLGDRGGGFRFLAVVGPSGSGKSSVVRAGLIPALRSGALPDSAGWFVLDMHPGSHPFEEFEAALMRIATDPAPGLVDRLERDDAGLVRAAAEILPEDGDLLLLVDQFEELFTLVEDEDLRGRFVRALHTAATHPRSRLRIIVTLRADFYDGPLSYPGLAELVKARTVTVTPLTPEELERAVSGPSERVGVRVDPSLVAKVAAEVAAQPGALPLLQYALAELFDHRTDSTLTVAAYHEIGGVSGALVQRAEDLYAKLNEAGQDAARQLFLRLLILGGEGSEDTRRRVLRAEFTSLEVDAEAMEAVIDTFGARRLLSFDRDPATRGPTVEVAHEALLREWGRLRRWIEETREDVRVHRLLSAAARDWAEAGRDPGHLPRRAHLARFEATTASSDLALTGEERAYLEASVAQRDAERKEEEARVDRERALERRSIIRLRALVAVLSAAALLAGGLTLFAFTQRGRAERETRVASARELAAAAVANLDADPERSILLALEAVDATWESDRTVLREAEEALRRALKSSRVVRTIPQGGFGLGVSSDGALLATAGSDQGNNTATLWDLRTGRRLRVLTGSDVGRPAVALSADGRLVATTHDDGTVRIWDVAAGEEVHLMRGHAGPVTFPTFSPDGKWLATGGQDATVRIWDVAAGTEEVTLTGDAVTLRPEFSPDGSRLAIAGGDDTEVRIWDLAKEKTVVTLRGHGFGVNQAVFSPNGARVATASSDGTARIWDAQSGAQLVKLANPGLLRSVDYSPDGTRLATGGGDATARVWDAATGRELLSLAGHSNDVWSVAFTPDGNSLVGSGLDDTTRVWDITVAGARDWLTVPGATDTFTGVTFSPDGTRFAAPAEPSGVTIWDSETGEEIITLTGHDPKLTTVAFSPDGARLAAGSDLTDTPPVWDVETGDLLMTLTGHQASVRSVAFSPDGTRIITGSHDRTARVWNAATGQVEATLGPFDDGVFAAAFSPDGRLIATTEFSTVRLWDTTALEEVGTLSGHGGSVEGITFGPDGMFLTASGDATAKIWDLTSREVRVTLRGHSGFVSNVAMSPDGSRVATVSDDGTARLWDPTTGRELLTLPSHDTLVFGVDFSPDGRLIATASPDGTVALHLLPIDELRVLARERVTRTFTDEECRQYLRFEACP